MKRLTDWFKSLRVDEEIINLADQVAQHSHDAVWTLASQVGVGLSLVESRGYVRARARATVEQNVDWLMSKQPAHIVLRKNDVSREAMRRVVSRVVTELSDARVYPAVQRRAA